MFVFVRVFQRNKTGGRYIDIYKAVYYRTWIMLSCRLTPKLCLQVETWESQWLQFSVSSKAWTPGKLVVHDPESEGPRTRCSDVRMWAGEDGYLISSNETSFAFLCLFVVFKSSGDCRRPPTLGRTIFFTLSTDSNAKLFWRCLHRNI